MHRKLVEVRSEPYECLEKEHARWKGKHKRPLIGKVLGMLVNKAASGAGAGWGGGEG